MTSLNKTKCCGVMEIDDLSAASSPEAALKALTSAIKTGFEHPDPWGFGGKKTFHVPYILFTGVIARKIPDHASDRKDNYGEALATYIEQNNLGTVVRSLDRANWTGNLLRVWIWHPDYETLLPHLESLT